MMKIDALIVDDSAVMRKIIERALRLSGIELNQVLTANNGREGLRVLAENQVGVVLSDVSMPLMDGLEFVRTVRAQKLAEGVPIVMITTESGEEHVKTAIASGAQGYIKKPFTPDQVRSRLLPLLPQPSGV